MTLLRIIHTIIGLVHTVSNEYFDWLDFHIIWHSIIGLFYIECNYSIFREATLIPGGTRQN